MVLGLSPGSPVLRFHRIRYADDMPMALEYSTIPGQYLASEEAVEASLYEALEKTGSRPVRALQRLRAVLFTPEQAELLEIEAGAPGLLIERRGFLPDGRRWSSPDLIIAATATISSPSCRWPPRGEPHPHVRRGRGGAGRGCGAAGAQRTADGHPRCRACAHVRRGRW